MKFSTHLQEIEQKVVRKGEVFLSFFLCLCGESRSAVVLLWWGGGNSKNEKGEITNVFRPLCEGEKNDKSCFFSPPESVTALLNPCIQLNSVFVGIHCIGIL